MVGAEAGTAPPSAAQSGRALERERGQREVGTAACTTATAAAAVAAAGFNIKNRNDLN